MFKLFSIKFVTYYKKSFSFSLIILVILKKKVKMKLNTSFINKE